MDYKEEIRLIFLAVVSFSIGIISHKTDPLFVELQQSGTGYRWINWGRYAVGLTCAFSCALLYFIGRRVDFKEALLIFSQVCINYGGGVVVGGTIDEIKSRM